MARKSTTSKRIAATNTPKPSNADNFKEVFEFLTSQLKPLYKDGIVPLNIREKQLSAVIGLTTSTIQKNRCKYQAGSKNSPLPPYCKTPGVGVVYRLIDVVNWYLRLNQQNGEGGRE